MSSRRVGSLLRSVLVVAMLSVVAACAGSDGDQGGGDGTPLIVVTTTVLGDVVAQLAGADAEVEVVMPSGVSPHDFQPSARQVTRLGQADLVVANGGDLEEGLGDVLEQLRADGVPVLQIVDPDSEASGISDPHFATDVRQMIVAATTIADRLVADGLIEDGAATEARVDAYLAALQDLHEDFVLHMPSIPPENRTIVTNHEALDAFAERYGFTIVGAVIPGRSTGGAATAGALAELERTIDATGAAAIFLDRSSSADVAETLAADAGIPVVGLYTESLGPDGSGASTYIDMMRANLDAILAALS